MLVGWSSDGERVQQNERSVAQTTLLDSWALMPDFRILLQPWELQISLPNASMKAAPAQWELKNG